MAERPSELELMAYADGELDAAASGRVRQFIESDAAAAAKVRLHQNLREAGRRAMADVPVPMGLMARLAEVAVERPRRGWRMGWVVSAAAALLLGFGVMFMVLKGKQEPGDVNTQVVPVSWVADAEQVHDRCSKHREGHATPQFSRDLKEMPATLVQYLGQSARCPDLEQMGYEFCGCAPCQISGGKTAHLLYAPKSGEGPCLSLFVQANTGQVKLGSGKVYWAGGKQGGAPVMVWATEQAVYWLVGEERDVKRAAEVMGVGI